MSEDIEECIFRKFELHEGCGGAGYWWCYNTLINKQINIYEDCRKCDSKQYKDGSNWSELIDRGGER
jgi:hypothetical protein